MEEFITKKGKKLTGKRLETFLRFWNAFDYKNGKAAAADSWLQIKVLTDSIVLDIISAAKKEAARRQRLLDSNRTPKMAQGWLTDRRWEDSVYKDMKSETMPNGANLTDIEKMFRAFQILDSDGEKPFREFCAKYKMPHGDIEAVEYKYKGVHDVATLTRGIGG